MAIVFTAKPDETKYQPYGNNLVFEFSDNNAIANEYAIVQIGNTELRLYPSPVGTYYVNIKEIVRNSVVNVNLLDLPVPSAERFSVQHTELNATLIFSTYASNDVVISTTSINYEFLPFSVDYEGTSTLLNKTVGTTVSLTHDKTRHYTNLPFYVYYKYIQIYKDSLIEVPGVTFVNDGNTCGTYLKFFNKLGGYSYWLFTNPSESTNISSLGELNNDFYNLDTTTNPMLQAGKESRRTLTCSTGVLQNWEHKVVRDILTSPKVYLHKGNDKWLEVAITNTSVKTADAKRNEIEYNITIALPYDNNITL